MYNQTANRLSATRKSAERRGFTRSPIAARKNDDEVKNLRLIHSAGRREIEIQYVK